MADQWAVTIDAIAATAAAAAPFNPKEPWDPAAFLPGLTAPALQFAQRSVAEHATQSTYYSQLTLEEALRVKPAPPKPVDSFLAKTPAELQVAVSVTKHEGIDFHRLFAELEGPEGPKPAGTTAEASSAVAATPRTSGTTATAVAAAITGTPQRGILGVPSGSRGRRVDFMPVIVVPSSATSILQMWNAVQFLETGMYVEASRYFVDPRQGGTFHQERPSEAVVSPGKMLGNADDYRVKFRNFKVLDDATHIPDWAIVCAVIVTGQPWQLRALCNEDPKRNDPSVLFSEVRGFMPVFEEDKAPDTLKTWNVVPLQMSRKTTKEYMHVQAAKVFWEKLFEFLCAHPHFRQYTVAADG